MTAFTGISRRNETLILRNMTGRLFKSFNPQTAGKGDSANDVNLAGNIYTAVIGSNVPYAAIHNYGGEIKNGWGRGILIKMPKRPYFDKAVEKLRASIDEEMKKYFEMKFAVAVKTFVYKGEGGLLMQFVQELRMITKDLEIRLPLLVQKFVGTSMQNISVNPNWKGTG